MDGPDTAIDIVGALDRMTVENCIFRGAFDEATIHNATGNIATDVFLIGNYVENADASALAVDLDSACTGFAAHNIWDVPSKDPTSVVQVDMGSLRLFENYGTDSADGNAIIHPAVIT